MRRIYLSKDQKLQNQLKLNLSLSKFHHYISQIPIKKYQEKKKLLVICQQMKLNKHKKKLIKKADLKLMSNTKQKKMKLNNMMKLLPRSVNQTWEQLKLMDKQSELIQITMLSKVT